MIANVWASFVRLVGRGASWARKGKPRPRTNPRVISPGTEDPRKRQADRSDVRQEYVRLKEPEPVFELNPSGRAPALHASRVSHDPCLQNLSLRFAHARRMRPLFVGRVTTPLIQRLDHQAMILIHVKKLGSYGQTWLIGSAPPAPIVLAVKSSP